MPRRRYGPVERATRDRLNRLPDPDPAIKALAAALAREMDEAPSAAVARELRLTVQALLPQPAPAKGEPSPSSAPTGLAQVVGRIGGASS